MLITNCYYHIEHQSFTKLLNVRLKNKGFIALFLNFYTEYYVGLINWRNNEVPEPPVLTKIDEKML